VNYLACLEQDPSWQTTAEREGELIVFMRGQNGARFEKGFYTIMEGGLPGHPVLGSWLREQFASGKLKLVRGSLALRLVQWRHD
jgi:hypothetical protein